MSVPLSDRQGALSAEGGIKLIPTDRFHGTAQFGHEEEVKVLPGAMNKV